MRHATYGSLTNMSKLPLFNQRPEIRKSEFVSKNFIFEFCLKYKNVKGKDIPCLEPVNF